MQLRNRRVVITGASRGIGAALADEFAAAGAELILLARSAPQLTDVAERTGAAHIVCDITDSAARAEAIEQIESNGPIDVWINNAGVTTHGPFVEHDPADISMLFALNLEAPIQFCRAVLPAMIDRGEGHIVNVSSMAMAVTTPLFATYGASKAGLSSFAESLRVELRDTGVGLTTVEIGETDTDMLTDLRTDAEVDAMYRFYEKIKLQRVIEPAEVAVATRAAVEAEKPFVRLPRRCRVPGDREPATQHRQRSPTRPLSPLSSDDRAGPRALCAGGTGRDLWIGDRGRWWLPDGGRARAVVRSQRG